MQVIGERLQQCYGQCVAKACNCPQPLRPVGCKRLRSLPPIPVSFLQGCQRYWTAGGTLRNVPVGAGRRKNKASAAKEAARDPSRKPASSKDSMEPSFMSFPVMDPSLAAYGAGACPGLPLHPSNCT